MKIKNALQTIKTLCLFSLILCILCGLVYPLAVTGLGNLLFRSQAQGSIVYAGEKAVGSLVVGQQFTDPRFMKGRPSAVSYNTYTPEQKEAGSYTGPATGSQNLAPSNPKLAERVKTDIAAFLVAHPDIKTAEIPADLLTASGSGLDPHISPQAAAIQIPALSKHTGISPQKLAHIIEANTQEPLLGIFGEKTVHVLGVNLSIAKELGIHSLGE